MFNGGKPRLAYYATAQPQQQGLLAILESEGLIADATPAIAPISRLTEEFADCPDQSGNNPERSL